ncbi:ankyrin repeat domain-containing protein 50-like [Haliotis asinina]|uniref:ankyrin repeat domain-containing protein 50-like n=1 Tax=Haliotis asinina TaxID=109174 RepID=UPI0035321735
MGLEILRQLKTDLDKTLAPADKSRGTVIMDTSPFHNLTYNILSHNILSDNIYKQLKKNPTALLQREHRVLRKPHLLNNLLFHKLVLNLTEMRNNLESPKPNHGYTLQNQIENLKGQVTSGICGSTVCNDTSQCVVEGCEMVCLEAPPLCDLHNASKIGDFSRVNAILSQRRANIDCQEWIGRTPVMLAALKGRREVVESLMTKGASVKLIDRFGMNILHSACLGGDRDVMKYILSLDMTYIDVRAQCKRTPMMLAAENGHKEVVELLVNEGADMSLVDKQRNNILHCACRGGRLEVVMYIVSQNKVDINSRGWKKKTPLMLAAANGAKDVVKFLVEHGADLSLTYAGGSNTLHLASWGGHLEVVKYIVSQNKVDINSRGWQKKTPLMVAAANGAKDVVKFLVEHGADLLLVHGSGINTLHMACRGGHLEVVKYIVSQNKVDINSRGWKKKTPVMVAAEMGKKDVVEFLVEHGADLSLLRGSGSNILHMACKEGHLEVVKYIVSQNKVDINSRGWKRNTPVMLAASNGHKKVVEFLVSKGADL